MCVFNLCMCLLYLICVHCFFFLAYVYRPTWYQPFERSTKHIPDAFEAYKCYHSTVSDIEEHFYDEFELMSPDQDDVIPGPSTSTDIKGAMALGYNDRPHVANGHATLCESYGLTEIRDLPLSPRCARTPARTRASYHNENCGVDMTSQSLSSNNRHVPLRQISSSDDSECLDDSDIEMSKVDEHGRSARQ